MSDPHGASLEAAYETQDPPASSTDQAETLQDRALRLASHIEATSPAAADFMRQTASLLQRAIDGMREPDVTIERKRFSVTQGEVLLIANGERLGQFGDDIRIQRMGEPPRGPEVGGYAGHPDSYWFDVARRFVVGAALHRTEVALDELLKRP